MENPAPVLFCIAFLPSANYKVLNLLNRKRRRSQATFEGTLNSYFSRRSSKAGAISLRLVRRLLPSCLSREPSDASENSVCLKDFLIACDLTTYTSFNSRNIFQLLFLRPLFESSPYSRASIIGAGTVTWE